MSSSTKALRRRLYREHPYCYWCGCPCVFTCSVVMKRKVGKSWFTYTTDKPPGNYFTVEHVHMLAAGGDRGGINAVGACWSCNQNRNNMLMTLLAGKGIHPDFLGEKPSLRKRLFESILPFIVIGDSSAPVSMLRVNRDEETYEAARLPPLPL